VNRDKVRYIKLLSCAKVMTRVKHVTLENYAILMAFSYSVKEMALMFGRQEQSNWSVNIFILIFIVEQVTDNLNIFKMKHHNIC
jgi:hypothetical protein